MSKNIGFEDIASSCRHEYAHYEDEMFRDSFDPEVLLRAADEIERLREENDKASALIAKLAELLLPYSMLMNKHEQEMLIKAVRGE